MEVLACSHLSPVVGEGFLNFEIESFIRVEGWLLNGEDQ